MSSLHIEVPTSSLHVEEVTSSLYGILGSSSFLLEAMTQLNVYFSYPAQMRAGVRV